MFAQVICSHVQKSMGRAMCTWHAEHATELAVSGVGLVIILRARNFNGFWNQNNERKKDRKKENWNPKCQRKNPIGMILLYLFVLGLQHPWLEKSIVIHTNKVSYATKSLTYYTLPNWMCILFHSRPERIFREYFCAPPNAMCMQV